MLLFFHGMSLSSSCFPPNFGDNRENHSFFLRRAAFSVRPGDRHEGRLSVGPCGYPCGLPPVEKPSVQYDVADEPLVRKEFSS